MGNRPQQGTASIWWSVAAEVESAIHQGEPLPGFVTDVCKAFNNLTRPVVYECALHFRLPLQFVRTWHRAVNRLQRHFIVQGSCSGAMRSCTGYPDKGPMSVVAMMLDNCAMHHVVEKQVAPVTTFSFVDNWEGQSSCVAATQRLFASM